MKYKIIFFINTLLAREGGGSHNKSCTASFLERIKEPSIAIFRKALKIFEGIIKNELCNGQI